MFQFQTNGFVQQHKPIWQKTRNVFEQPCNTNYANTFRFKLTFKINTIRCYLYLRIDIRLSILGKYCFAYALIIDFCQQHPLKMYYYTAILFCLNFV